MSTAISPFLRLRMWHLAGTLAVLPVLAIILAYGLNAQAGTAPVCTPFLSGCVSISRAVRVEPGLPWFRLLMIPCTALLALFWILLHARLAQLRQRATATLLAGLTGAFFLLLYISFLGTTGEMSQWLRRTGIIFFFAGTGLAQLLLARTLQTDASAAARQCRQHLLLLCTAMVMLGVFNTITQYGLGAPEEWENIGEWWLGLLLCTGFVTMARWQYRQSGECFNCRAGRLSPHRRLPDPE